MLTNGIRKKGLLENLRLSFFCGHPLKLSNIIANNQQFDGAIAIGTLGFLDDGFDLRILKNIVKVLRIGSILILEIEDRDWTLRNFQKFMISRHRDIEMCEEWKFNSESSISESVSKFYQVQKDNNRSVLLELRTTLRLYSLHEVIKLLTLAGLSYLGSYESIFNLIPLTHLTQDMIVVARKLE